MKYNVLKRQNPLNREEEKYYLNARMLGHIGLGTICEEIALASSLTRGDVVNTIMSYHDSVVKYLRMSFSVSLGELGNLRLSLGSYGAETIEEVNTSLLKFIRPVFVASPKLRKEIQNTSLELFPIA